MNSESAAIQLLRFAQEDSRVDLEGADEATISAQAYRDWATCEAINRVLDKPFEDAIIVLEEFLTELLTYFAASSDPSSDNPFSIAYDQIERVLAMLEHPTE